MLCEEECAELTECISRTDENSGTTPAIQGFVVSDEDTQCRACIRHVRSFSSSPTPTKRERLDNQRSFSDGARVGQPVPNHTTEIQTADTKHAISMEVVS
ncbi:hypothetical protein HHI36_023394 [Cryptolaemus montrouzieri]|uniref:Uncharacterized protein n=1 Tax=Cryptolaemus montrouzieri TaxID=559131 RepID=A0ABD2PH04_9CUCU